ncbi:MAG: RNA-binding S4 domain-containing protein [Bacteroidales bacterium]|nr:RNA-binding S4 domain-containing protein [Bacteroidales bacterium]
MDKIRVDKWLWCMRIFKTRTMASDACRKSRVLVEGMPVKPSRDVSIDDVIIVRKPPVIHTFRVKNLVNNRLPAKKVPEYMEDLTSSDELDKLKVKETIVFYRERGTGRPTKKERRDIDRLKNQ